MTNTQLRWGILGPGRIAHSFAKSLKFLKDARLTAVGSRSLERAREFAGQYGIPHAWGSYAELAVDGDVDILYIATPHPMHYENALMGLQAGKAVLLEKPFTLNARQAEEVIKTARGGRLFLMEAMWTRFLPAIVRVRQMLADGVIGEVRQVRADFGFHGTRDEQGRLLNPDLGGGALLDVGIYTVSFAAMVFGRQPESIASAAHIGTTGVDEQFSAVFSYPGGALATVTGAVSTETPHDAWILGEAGFIHIPNFWHAKSIRLCVRGKLERTYRIPFRGPGYQFEAAEVMHCLREGRAESEIMPLDETLAIMHTLDMTRAGWGMQYPGEG